MNDEMGMKGGSGTWYKPQYLRVFWTFLIHIFLHQLRKQLSRIFTLPNPGEICKHLARACNSNNYTRGILTSYFCMQGNLCNWHTSFKGSDQWKKRGVEKLASVRRWYQTVAIDICLLFNLVLVFSLKVVGNEKLGGSGVCLLIQ